MAVPEGTESIGSHRSRRRCAFLSLAETDGWCIHDDLLVAPLAARGWAVDPRIPWTATDVDWHEYDAVVVRSTWDYQDDPARFVSVLRGIESATTPALPVTRHATAGAKSPTARSGLLRTGNARVSNSVELVAWNVDKRYLTELPGRDCPIIPSDVVLADGDVGTAAALAAATADDASGVMAEAATSQATPATTATLPTATNGSLGEGTIQRGSAEAERRIRAALARFPEVVVKPLIGASSFDTFRVSGAAFDAPFVFEEDPVVLATRGRPTVFAGDGTPTPSPASSSPTSPDAPPNPPPGQQQPQKRDFPRMADCLSHLFATRSFIVQPYLPTIATHGEYGLFYLGGQLSHAMRKLPKAGDFRIQEEYGSTHARVPLEELPAAYHAIGARAVAALPAGEQGAAAPPPLYLRVDVLAVPLATAEAAEGWGVGGGAVPADHPCRLPSVVADGDSTLSSHGGSPDGTPCVVSVMEVEAIEPSLYFNLAPEGIPNFVDAFCRQYGDGWRA